MTKQKISSLIILLVLFFVTNTWAQKTPKVSASIDKSEQDTVLIGDWIKLSLEAEFDAQYRIDWPPINEQVGDFEVVEMGSIDTLAKGDVTRLQQQVIITAFDSGFFEIPPFEFIYANRAKQQVAGKITTQAMTLPVFSLSINPEEDIKAIKDPLEVPLTFREKMMYALMALGALLFLLALYFIIRRLMYPKEEVEKEPEIILPPHEIAFKKLKELEGERMWQRGQIKKYYSELTDIVREYIENRYKIPALEMTSDEIITRLRKENVSKRVCNKLRDMLSMADLVKFAKSKPGVDVNTQSLIDADVFIRKTKKLEQLIEEVEAEA